MSNSAVQRRVVATKEIFDALPWFVCILLTLTALTGYASLDALILLTITSLVPNSWRVARTTLSLFTGVVFSIAVLLAFADSALNYFFARSVDIQYDLLLIPTVWDLVAQSSGTFTAFIVFAAGFSLLAALGWLGAQVIKNSWPITSLRSVKIPLLIATGFFVWAEVPSKSPISRTVSGLQGAVNIHNREDPFEQILLAAENKVLKLPWNLKQVSGQDVMLLFVESYGRVLWDDPAARAAFKPIIEQGQKDLEAAGYYIASTFMHSPTYSGRSWLAHMTVLTGVTTQHQSEWQRMLTSRVLPLAHYFNLAGYETVTVAPNMDIKEWPEGDFFQFKKNFWAPDINYKGPRYGWSKMPDQYLLLQIHKQIIEQSTDPIFAEVTLTTSHAPFITPPFVDETPLREEALIAKYNSQKPPKGPVIWDLTPEKYISSVNYSLKSVWQFLAKEYPRQGTFIVLGDHQPANPVHRVNARSLGHHWDVPFHLVTKDETIYNRAVESGFTPGLMPDEKAEPLPMEASYSLLLTLFSEQP